MDGAVVVYQYDVHRGGQFPVLEGVVQDNQMGVLLFYQFLAAPDAVFVHGYRDRREFVGHLGGLVSVHEGGTVSGNQLKSFAMPLVASGQDGNVAESPVVALQELPQNHFRMRSLSGAAYCDVSNTDGGNIGLADLLDLFVVSEVAQGQDEPVQHYIESTLRTEISS